MAKLTGLMKRGGVYYLRVMVPLDLRDAHEGRSKLIKSLQTKDWLLDMLAVVARKDYTDRRRRQAQGIQKAKDQGLYKGRRADTERHAAIADMLDRGMSWSQVCAATGASRSTVKRVVDSRKCQELA